MGKATSAMMNSHLRGREKPKSNVNGWEPYVLIFEPLAAMSVLTIGRSVRQKEADTEERGIIDTAAPVSTRNDVLERQSMIKNKIEVERLE